MIIVSSISNFEWYQNYFKRQLKKQSIVFYDFLGSFSTDTKSAIDFLINIEKVRILNVAFNYSCFIQMFECIQKYLKINSNNWIDLSKSPKKRNSTNLLYQSFNCRNCGSIVSIYTNNDQKFGLCFKCSKCKRFYSILYLSIFYHSKISINSVLYLIYCWSHRFQLFQAAHEVGVSENTVSFFYQQFRSACFDYLMDMENELIGGKNKIVEIDEGTLP